MNIKILNMNTLCENLIKKINSYLLPDEIYLMILNKYTNKIFIDLTKLYKSGINSLSIVLINGFKYPKHWGCTMK